MKKDVDSKVVDRKTWYWCPKIRGVEFIIVFMLPVLLISMTSGSKIVRIGINGLLYRKIPLQINRVLTLLKIS